MAFGSESKMNSAINEAKDQLQPEISEEKFKTIINHFFAKMHDGHSHLSSFKDDSKDEEQKLLPLQFKTSQDSFFIHSVMKEEYKALIGCNLTHINQTPIAEVLDRVSLISPTENRYAAKNKLAHYLADNVSSKKLFPTITDSLSVTCASNEKTSKIKYLKKKESNQWISSGKKVVNTNPSFLNHEFVENTAYLKLDAIMAKEAFEIMQNMNMDGIDKYINYLYDNYLNEPAPKNQDQAIAKIPALSDRMSAILTEMKNRNSKYLVIDLRENGGGWTPIVLPVLYMIYGDKYYGTKLPYQFKTKISPLYLKKNNVTIEEFNKKNKTNLKIGEFTIEQDDDSPALEKRNKALKEAKSGKHTYSYLKHIEKLDGKAVYTPQVVFLVAPNTFSAAYHFMWFAWYLGAKTVGVTPSQAGNCFMEVTEFELQNTKLKGTISNSAQIFFPEDKEMGKEFIPDFPMTLADYKKYDFSDDAELLYVLDLIKSQKI